MKFDVAVQLDWRIWVFGVAYIPRDQYTTHNELVVYIGALGVVFSWL